VWISEWAPKNEFIPFWVFFEGRVRGLGLWPHSKVSALPDLLQNITLRADFWESCRVASRSHHSNVYVIVCCSVLQCVAVCCSMLQCFTVCCNVPLPRTSTLYNAQHTATHCNTLQHTATHCNTLQHAVPFWGAPYSSRSSRYTVQHTAKHCNTLQHAATRCNTLQHAATHCTNSRSPLLLAIITVYCATRCNTLQHTVPF